MTSKQHQRNILDSKGRLTIRKVEESKQYTKLIVVNKNKEQAILTLRSMKVLKAKAIKSVECVLNQENSESFTLNEIIKKALPLTK